MPTVHHSFVHDAEFGQNYCKQFMIVPIVESLKEFDIGTDLIETSIDNGHIFIPAQYDKFELLNLMYYVDIGEAKVELVN